MSSIHLDNVSKSFKKTLAVQGINLEVKDGECVVLLGPSGAGKSTILNIIAGFELPDSGTIMIDEKDVVLTPTRERGLGMVFQNYALYPHKTVYENLSFPLKMNKKKQYKSKTFIDQRVKEVANLLGIKEKLYQKPGTLSGGEQQRVAFGRAIIKEATNAVLMDEPFSNLDLLLRRKLRAELSNLVKRLNLTLLFVTHDQEEGMSLADKLVVLKNGSIQQVGTPEEVYFKPINRFVAEFIGKTKTNFMVGKIQSRDGQRQLKIGCFFIPLLELDLIFIEPDIEDVSVGIRAESVSLEQFDERCLSLQFKQIDKEFLGGSYLLKGHVNNSYFEFACRDILKLSLDNSIKLFVRLKDILIFDNVSHKNIRK